MLKVVSTNESKVSSLNYMKYNEITVPMVETRLMYDARVTFFFFEDRKMKYINTGGEPLQHKVYQRVTLIKKTSHTRCKSNLLIHIRQTH
jgi:hypothetical protein